MEIHSDAARELDLGEGDFVIVSTRYANIRVKLTLVDDVRKDCLRMTHGWDEANVNELTGLDHFDPLSGFPWLRALPARVEKEGALLRKTRSIESQTGK